MKRIIGCYDELDITNLYDIRFAGLFHNSWFGLCAFIFNDSFNFSCDAFFLHFCVGWGWGWVRGMYSYMCMFMCFYDWLGVIQGYCWLWLRGVIKLKSFL
jgi:hypothetical protein